MNNIHLSEFDMLIRLGLGFLAGAVIGLERASRHQVAGLRTHILISTGATLLMLLSIWLPQEYNGLKNGDPGRIAAQVVSGIGFLGAGAIIRLGNNIKGLTTAASLWLIAAVGMTIGAGMFVAAGATLLITLITLMILNRVERRFFPLEQNKQLELVYDAGNANPDDALQVLKTFSIRVHSMEMDVGKGDKKGIRLRLHVVIPESVDIAKLANSLKTRGKVDRIKMQESY
jgi:putative Mg2+ transporter-C (MgtC) family protein